MAGPSLDIIASLREGSNRDHISGRISNMVAKYGLGILVGVEPIRRLYNEEGTMLDELAGKVENPLVLSTTSNPKLPMLWKYSYSSSTHCTQILKRQEY